MISVLSKKKEDLVAEIEIDNTEIVKITTAWDEFVCNLCLSDKSKEYV